MNKKGNIIKNCKHCGNVFNTYQLQIDRGFGKFCSRRCAAQRPATPKAERRCLYCDAKFAVFQYKIDQGYGFFCSKQCSKMEDFNPSWKGKDRENLRYIKFLGKKALIHRWIAEAAINRDLKSSEVVHHIDQNPNNNGQDNLYIFRHQAAHARWHGFLRRHNLDGRTLKSNLSILCESAV